MVTRQELAGHWNEIKGRIRERWGQISDDELQQVQGDSEQLLGLIQQKTGHTREEAEEFFDSMFEDTNDVRAKIRKTADEYAHRAQDAFREGYDQVNENVQVGYRETERAVRARPVESVMTAFGVGVVAGVVVSLLLKPTRR
ncbi:MAG: DUF883 family protein [Planctomycetaceae bacterium]|nr:DUF883 family protein [Planctomycetaceae bacterium]